ncbi:MAG: DNA-directed DNA polymerase epsilon, subunit B [Claussenomyces sp. TS43310]|nr:MAG: DNA-directed DNA polymerase epsilon, subunit B [Claussenomyces sp. TS43310]
MSRMNSTEEPRAAPIFRPPATPASSNVLPSSSPAFATPAHPIRKHHAVPTSKPSILPILLPPATLRPLAFRTFTKKHSLTLTSSALQVLASFIGRHCGAEWREQGLAEMLLEEVARSWKRTGGGVIVDAESAGKELEGILRSLEGNMSGGRIVKGLSRQNSLASVESLSTAGSLSSRSRPNGLGREDSQSSLGMSSLEVEDDENEENGDPRKWLKVIDAYDQPRLVYDVKKKHFERDNTKPSLLPPPSHKTQVFRNRYNLIHQRLLRNESFQTSSVEGRHNPSLRRTPSTLTSMQQSYKLTPIANLLGRNGSTHLLLGLLAIAPTGTLAINDLTGSIALDLTHARVVPEDGAWFAPGMIVLVDGIYEEEENVGGSALGGGGGVGGTIGGKFISFTVGGPPCERRQVTLGVSGTNDKGDITAGGGFGWIDFLGVGSERAIGAKMRKIEQRLIGHRPTDDSSGGRGRMAILSEVNLDQPETLQALKKLLSLYAAEPEGETPMTFVLMGNFVSHAIMARGGSGGSIEYKEYFDALASVLAEYPTLLQASTFVFVPGDNDGWASSFSSGAATPIPRRGVPDMFTSRIKRAFAGANADAERERGHKGDGEAVWTTNPSRLSLFGPACELVLFRDDMSSRLRRTAIRFASSTDVDDDEDVEADTSGRHPTSSSANTTTARSEPNPDPVDLDAMDIDATVAQAESIAPTSAPASTSTSISPPPLPADAQTARKLVKTLLDQAYLSPFPLAKRPVLWDHAAALQLYPLPTALVLADADAPAFCLSYEACHVMNPGPLVAPGRRGVARWVEYAVARNLGSVRELAF